VRLADAGHGKLIVRDPSDRLYLSIYLDTLITRGAARFSARIHVASFSASVAPLLSKMEIACGPRRVRWVDNVMDHRGCACVRTCVRENVRAYMPRVCVRVCGRAGVLGQPCNHSHNGPAGPFDSFSNCTASLHPSPLEDGECRHWVKGNEHDR